MALLAGYANQLLINRVEIEWLRFYFKTWHQFVSHQLSHSIDLFAFKLSILLNVSNQLATKQHIEQSIVLIASQLAC